MCIRDRLRCIPSAYLHKRSQLFQCYPFPVSYTHLDVYKRQGIAASQNPEGAMAFWCSIIPFTAPVVMMVRAPFEISIWELALSVVILYATAILMVKLAAKVYRVGILMYGKKVTFSEMFKWLRYK